MKASSLEIKKLNDLYTGRRPFYGELHDHANTYGTSDGRYPLMHWRGAMSAYKMDFAAILDHKQVSHMYLVDWEDGVFLGGSEPGTVISDSGATKKSTHYNLIFENARPLMDLLSAFPEYNYPGGPEDHFEYPEFTCKRFGELIDGVKERGGFFVIPHPKQLMQSENPLDYWFRDGVGLEVIYEKLADERTEANYKLWNDLLALDKRIFATAGCDHHSACQDTALTTIYAEDRKNKFYISHLRDGDFVAGAVGIRMCIGDTKMGGSCAFDGEKLIIGVGDFHCSVKNPEHKYRVDILDDKGVVASKKISCEEDFYLTLNTSAKAKFYRAEVFDIKRNLRIAIGNPIWNDEIK